MIRQKTLTCGRALDPLPTLDRLTEAAIEVVEVHRRDATCCAGCGIGSVWGEVVLAGRDLAVR